MVFKARDVASFPKFERKSGSAIFISVSAGLLSQFRGMSLDPYKPFRQVEESAIITETARHRYFVDMYILYTHIYLEWAEVDLWYRHWTCDHCCWNPRLTHQSLLDLAEVNLFH